MKWPFRKVVFPCIIMIVPIVHMPFENDSMGTKININGGLGSYSTVAKSCDGEVLERGEGASNYIATGLEHGLYRGQLGIGLQGVFSTMDTAVSNYQGEIENNRIPFNTVENQMINPYAKIDVATTEMRFGMLFLERGLVVEGGRLEYTDGYVPSFSLSHSVPEKGKYKFSYMEAENLYTLGYGHFMILTNSEQDSEYGVGLSFIGPHRGTGIIFQGIKRFDKRLQMSFSGRLAPHDGDTQGAFSIGMSYQIRN